MLVYILLSVLATYLVYAHSCARTYAEILRAKIALLEEERPSITRSLCTQNYRVENQRADINAIQKDTKDLRDRLDSHIESQNFMAFNDGYIIGAHKIALKDAVQALLDHHKLDLRYEAGTKPKVLVKETMSFSPTDLMNKYFDYTKASKKAKRK